MNASFYYVAALNVFLSEEGRFRLCFTGQRRIVPGGIRSRGVPSSEVDGHVPSAGKVDMRLPGKRNSNSHGARPLYFNHLDDEVDS